MKKINTTSVFDRNPLPFSFEKEGCRFYGRRRIAYSKYSAMPIPLTWNMYCVSSLYEDCILTGCHFRRENPAFLAVEYIREGNMFVRQDGRMYLAEPGDVVLLHPGCTHDFLTGPEAPCTKISALLTGPMLTGMLEQSGLKNCDVITNVNGYRLEELFKSLKALSFDFGGIACEQVVLLSYQLIQILLNQEELQSMPEKLSSLIAFLNENMSLPLSLEDMARHYGCSVPHLCRLFGRYCNTSPYNMLLRLRMRAAVSLLQENQLSIKEIAQRVGYESAFNFSTEFKKRFAVSPRNFRHATL